MCHQRLLNLDRCKFFICLINGQNYIIFHVHGINIAEITFQKSDHNFFSYFLPLLKLSN